MGKWTMIVAAAALMAGWAIGEDETVYAPPKQAAPEQGTNQGGVNFDLDFLMLTNYVYRGVDYSDVPGASGTDLNFLLDGKVSFDLGPRVPHPFIAALANVYNPDPVSQFQEVFGAIGADWTLKPVSFTAAVQTYTYPERDEANTAEAFGQAVLDDSRLFHAQGPVLKPYIAAAYDYVVNDGWYIEAGISHDFEFEDIGLTLTPIARIAYTVGWQQQFIDIVKPGTGWQHYDLGLLLKYKLNSLLNLSTRWGVWYITGQVFYTQHLSDDTVGQTVTWGGGGISFEY